MKWYKIMNYYYDLYDELIFNIDISQEEKTECLKMLDLLIKESETIFLDNGGYYNL